MNACSFVAMGIVVCVASSGCGGKIGGREGLDPTPTDESMPSSSSGESSGSPSRGTGGKKSANSGDEGYYDDSALEQAPYSAYTERSGGLIHLRIFEANLASDRCTLLHLTSPGPSVPDDRFASVVTSENWSLVEATGRSGAFNCARTSSSVLKPQATSATLAKGQITVERVPTTGTKYRCVVEANVQLLFAGSSTQYTLGTGPLTVDDCVVGG